MLLHRHFANSILKYYCRSFLFRSGRFVVNLCYFCRGIRKFMDRKTIQDATFPKCPIRNILSRIGDKWAMLVLYTLEQHDTLRFNDMYRRIPDISQKKMLTATLKTLTEDGLISRKLYPAVPPKVEYSLTDRGRSLLPHLDVLISWAIENFDGIISNRANSN